MELDFLPYRYADAVLEHSDFREAREELYEVLVQAEPPLLRNPKTRKRGGYVFPVDQIALNKSIDSEFDERGWEVQPYVVEPGQSGGPRTGLKADFKKGRIQVEVQFGNMARWYTDVFKFQLSYSLDQIDVGVLVVAKQRFAKLIDENIAHFERVCRELPWAKMSLTLPILVIGVEPLDYEPLRHAYDQAAENADIDIVPFDQRIGREEG